MQEKQSNYLYIQLNSANPFRHPLNIRYPLHANPLDVLFLLIFRHEGTDHFWKIPVRRFVRFWLQSVGPKSQNLTRTSVQLHGFLDATKPQSLHLSQSGVGSSAQLTNLSRKPSLDWFFRICLNCSAKRNSDKLCKKVLSHSLHSNRCVVIRMRRVCHIKETGFEEAYFNRNSCHKNSYVTFSWWFKEIRQ